MAFRDRRLRGTPRQEFLLLWRGGLPCPRVAVPSGGVRVSGPVPDRLQPVRRPGVRPAGRQPGHQAHHRRRVDPEGRLPPGPPGEEPAGIRQHRPPVHPGQRRRPAGTPDGPGTPAGTRRGRDIPHRRARRAAVPPAGERPPPGGTQPAGRLPGLVWPGIGVRGTPAELSERG